MLSEESKKALKELKGIVRINWNAPGMKRGGTVRKELKVNRNDPCPCGSGKKYKKCCA